MPYRPALPVGTERITNGYTVIRTEKGWVYKHRLIAEEMLGRPLEDNERVSFKDNDRSNFDPGNIEIKWKQANRGYRKRAFLQRKIQNLESKLVELREQLSNLPYMPHDPNQEQRLAKIQDGRGGRQYQGRNGQPEKADNGEHDG